MQKTSAYLHVAVFMVSIVLFAPAAVSAGSLQEIQDQCTNVSIFANAAMDVRQQGIRMAEAFKRADSMGLKQSQTDAVKKLIMFAYSLDLQHTREGKLEMIDDFSNFVFLDCMEQSGGFIR